MSLRKLELDHYDNLMGLCAVLRAHCVAAYEEEVRKSCRETHDAWEATLADYITATRRAEAARRKPFDTVLSI